MLLWLTGSVGGPGGPVADDLRAEHAARGAKHQERCEEDPHPAPAVTALHSEGHARRSYAPVAAARCARGALGPTRPRRRHCTVSVCEVAGLGEGSWRA